jgi:phycocyanobilin lyase subunit beta
MAGTRVAFASPIGALLQTCIRAPRRRARCATRMSGVNGGIDYEIDLATLPSDLAARVRYVQGGPDSPNELIDSARDIATASTSYPATIPVLVDMLGFNNPIAANVAVDALVRAGDAAVPSLLSGVAAFNYAVNAYALRALGRIGDPAVLEVCIGCAEKGPIPNVRRAACRALAGLRFSEPSDATRAHAVLVALVQTEPDWGVRYAAVVGLERFMCVGMLHVEERRRGIDAVQFVADQLEVPIPNSDRARSETEGLPSDPTVVARAVVAVAKMQNESVAP